MTLKLGRGTAIAGLLICAAIGGARGESGAAPALPPEIIGVTWEWLGLQTPKDAINVADPSSYTITFAADGSLALQVDCNRGVGSYSVTKDNQLKIAPIGTTMMMCAEGSLDGDFTTNLERVTSFFQLEGDLLLEQPFDSGTLRFRAAAVPARQLVRTSARGLR
jgi:heat shock protein HslJ